jgi:hypothetical protein
MAPADAPPAIGPTIGATNFINAGRANNANIISMIPAIVVSRPELSGANRLFCPISWKEAA